MLYNNSSIWLNGRIVINYIIPLWQRRILCISLDYSINLICNSFTMQTEKMGLYSSSHTISVSIIFWETKFTKSFLSKPGKYK